MVEAEQIKGRPGGDAQPPPVTPDRASSRIALNAWDVGMIALVVLAAALRFWGLTRQSMWYDELFSVTIVRNTSLASVIDAAASDTTPPLYFVAQWLLVNWLGISDFSMRVLSASAGVLTVVTVYLIGRLSISPRVGFVSAMLFTVGFLPLRYAQEARAYSLMMLFSALSLLCLVLLVRRVTAPRAIAYFACLTALCYIHVYGSLGAFGIVCASLLVPVVRRRIGWRGVVAGAGAGLAFIPWAFVLPRQMSKVVTWSATGSWQIERPDHPVDLLLKTIGSLAPWPNNFALASALIFGVLLFVALLPSWDQSEHAITRLPERRTVDEGHYGMLDVMPMSESASAALFALSALIPLILGLVLTVTIVPIHNVRNSIVVLPALYTLAACGLFRIWRPLALATLAAFLVVTVSGMRGYYTETPRGYSRQAARYLLDSGAQNDLVIVSNFMLPLNLNIYADILGGDGFWLAEIPAHLTGTELDRRIAAALEGQDDVWVVTLSLDRDASGRTPFSQSMSRQAGWTQKATKDFSNAPVIERWERE